MQSLTNSMWKIAATSLALIPGLYAIIFFMVTARTESFNVRMNYIEREIGKGARFTAHDGEVIRNQINELHMRHEKDSSSIRDIHSQIRYEDATLKANQQNLLIRFARIEEKLYALNIPKDNRNFKKSPYKLSPSDIPWWKQATWEVE